MIATVISAVSVIACLAGLGVGIVATMLGVTVAVLAQPGDCPVEIPPCAAGVMSMSLGLLVFIAAAASLLKLVA
jgi:hypothetical protein